MRYVYLGNALLLALALALPALAADTLDRVTINGEAVDFKGGYNLERCLEYDRLRNRVEPLDTQVCEGMRSYRARQEAARIERERQAAEAEATRSQAQANQAAAREERKWRAEEANKEVREREAQADAARAAEWPARMAKAEADRASEAHKAKLKEEHEACLATDAYAQYEIHQEIQEQLENLRGITALQAQERKIQRESGVRSLTRDYELGRDKVEVSAEMQANWREYKQRGGKGSSPNAMGAVAANPCKKFESDLADMDQVEVRP